MNVAGLVGLVLAHFLVGLTAAQGGCSRMVTRRDIMTLSQQEWSQTASVLQRMQNDGWFRIFAEIHNREFNNIHGNDNFFPWHRRFLRDFEEIGQRYDPNFAVPYWDELRDSRNPAGSPVLSSRLMGGNGFGGCVRDGLQQGWTMSFPGPHCLVRRYDRGGQMQSWYSPEYIFSTMQRYNDMHGLRENIEFTLHGSVHLGMGGDMSALYSSNDFVFFLHHANLDRLWAQWQSWGHQWTMDGRNHFGASIGLTSALPHYGDQVGSTMQLGVNRMCFRYAGTGSRRRSESSLALVSTPPGSNGETRAQEGLQNLPLPILQKWFPALVNSSRDRAPVSAAVAPKANTTRSTIDTEQPAGHFLVYPAPLTNEWVNMHRFDRQKVANTMEEAREFVDALNRAGYKSPY
ncbi:hypothetical protein GGI21_002438 [Coemansia aciculifera]|uniref:Uncharacterized protein n=1 Tax=Coemansia aciculifera TaxID=417176 RepID=A0ACC1M9L5_9FUNG|nr:hypothetical protein IWW38_000671 [Coemansia aciculifera]KAJ2908885.1 hypothetical protein GGI21_002438 [Coemansia aciculifera]